MKILMRNEGSEEWELVDAAGYALETELQELLADSPSLISIEEIQEGASPLIVAIREVGLPGSGNTDILAFNSQGDIVVVECKLAANQDIKRKVIAQVLEYGAFLWGMSYDDLNTRIHGRTNMNLAELVAEALGDEEWDEEAFRTIVEQNLSKGSFVLVIAVDEMNDELNRTMRFINMCGNPEFAFAVLEMKRFQRGKKEILVPKIYGSMTQSQARKQAAKRKKWTETEYFEDVETKLPKEVGKIISDLFQWSQKSADRVWFGTGIENGSFTYHCMLDKKTVSIFSVYSNGWLTLNFGWLSRTIDIELIKEFHKGLIQMAPFASIPDKFDRWPSIKIEDAFLDDSENLTHFMQLVEHFKGKVKQ